MANQIDNDQFHTSNPAEFFKFISGIPMMFYYSFPDEHSIDIKLMGGIKNITGYEREDFENDKQLWNDIIHKEDRIDVWKKIQEQRLRKKGLDIQYRIINRNGETRWMRDCSYCILDEKGKLEKTEGIIEDVTDMSEVRYNLEKSENRLRAMTWNAPVYIALVSASDLRYQYANNMFTTGFNLKTEEIIGKSIPDIIGEENFSYAEKFINIAREGEKSEYENIFNINGHKRWIRVNYEPLFEGGIVRDLVVIGYDLTDIKTTEEQLNESKKRYHLLYDNTLAAIYRTTPTGKIIDCNDSFVRILGFESKKELLEFEAKELYYNNADRKKFLDEIREKKLLRNYECKLKRRDGKEVWLLENIALVQNENGEEEINGTSIDITKLKNTSEQKRKSEENLRKIHQSVQAGIVLHRKDGAIEYVNQMAEQILKKTATEIEGKTSHDSEWQMVYEDGSDCPGTEHPAMITQRTGKATRDQIRGLYAGSKENMIWLQINTEPISYDEEHAPYPVLATFIDITKLKTTEQELKKRMEEVERFNQFMIGRESRMIELKREVNELLIKLGEGKRYDTPEE